MGKRFTQDKSVPTLFYSTKEVNEEVIKHLEQIIRLIRAEQIYAEYPAWMLVGAETDHPYMETSMEQEEDSMVVRVEVGTDPGTLMIRKEKD